MSYGLGWKEGKLRFAEDLETFWFLVLNLKYLVEV